MACAKQQCSSGSAVPSKPTVELWQLPTEWCLWLDPRSLLHARCAGLLCPADNAGAGSVEAQAWRQLCLEELGLPSSARLVVKGSIPVAKRQSEGRDKLCNEEAAKWRRLFYDLDAAPTLSGFGLRCTSEHYEFFPSKRGERAAIPPGIVFSEDDDGQCTQCRLRGMMGNDRCVTTVAPLPSLLSATALPFAPYPDAPREEWEWHLRYRSCGYYEVTIGENTGGASSRMETYGLVPCVSVGVCTPRLARYCFLNKQAGWDSESWAIHGDDGHVFHGSGRGEPFHWISPDSVRQPRHRPLVNDWRSGMPRTTFHDGDVVGCGVVYLLPYADDSLTASSQDAAPSVEKAAEVAAATAFERAKAMLSPSAGLSAPAKISATSKPLSEHVRGIFFTLNGEYMGMPFIVEDTPNQVPLWPCVGIDAPWPLSFNMGQRPFRFDLDAAMPSLELELADPFTTFESWPLNSARLRSTPTAHTSEDVPVKNAKWCPSPVTMRRKVSESSSPSKGGAVATADAADAADAAASSSSRSPTVGGSSASLKASSTMMPLVSKLMPGRILGSWAAVPATRAVKKYVGESGWGDLMWAAALAAMNRIGGDEEQTMPRHPTEIRARNARRRDSSSASSSSSASEDATSHRSPDVHVDDPVASDWLNAIRRGTLSSRRRVALEAVALPSRAFEEDEDGTDEYEEDEEEEEDSDFGAPRLPTGDAEVAEYAGAAEDPGQEEFQGMFHRFQPPGRS